jgi:succinoglycan biosynthesis protein ExoU
MPRQAETVTPHSAATTAVLIAAYNAETTLERAVASALAQPETAEVCIVDDGSTDATAAVARDLAARHRLVSVHGMKANAGPSAARNAAIAATSAPWIAILDADDYVLEGRLSALHARAADADFVADELMRSHPGADLAAPPPPRDHHALTFTEFVLGNLGDAKGPLDLGFLKPMFRREFLDRHALRYRPDMRLGEDYELYARAIALGARFLVCGPAGYVSIERPGSLSKDHSETDLRRLRDCDNGLLTVRRMDAAERRALKRHWHSVDCRLQWRRLISAVKARDWAAALSTFRSPQAAAFLAARLGEQAWLRGTALVRGGAETEAEVIHKAQG